MAKFLCVCGYSISTSGLIPNPDEWHCLSDEDFAAAFEGKTAVDELYLASTIFYRCPRSSHLWVFWDGIGQAPSLYSPTDTPDGWG